MYLYWCATSSSGLLVSCWICQTLIDLVVDVAVLVERHFTLQGRSLGVCIASRTVSRFTVPPLAATSLMAVGNHQHRVIGRDGIVSDGVW